MYIHLCTYKYVYRCMWSILHCHIDLPLEAQPAVMSLGQAIRSPPQPLSAAATAVLLENLAQAVDLVDIVDVGQR